MHFNTSSKNNQVELSKFIFTCVLRLSFCDNHTNIPSLYVGITGIIGDKRAFALYILPTCGHFDKGLLFYHTKMTKTLQKKFARIDKNPFSGYNTFGCRLFGSILNEDGEAGLNCVQTVKSEE